MTGEQIYHRMAAAFVRENGRIPDGEEARDMAREASALADYLAKLRKPN